MALENNAVTYPDYFGEGIHLVYTPTANGVKEDIVLDAYTGVNSFTFMLNTRGLNLYQANGRYYLAPGKGSELRFDLGDIVSFDAKGRFSIGTVTAETVSAGNLYRLTVTVDEEFLTDENTAYPVSIDPTIDISDNTHGAGTITDATIYQGSPYLNTGGWQYMHCGYYDSAYQVGRVAYNLPGLLFNTTISGSDIISAVFHVGEATGSAGVAVKLHVITSNWTEDSITWNSHSNSYSSYVQATAYPSYNNFASYDITNIVTDWLTGDLPEYGFMLVSSNETSIDKAFYSSEYSSTAYRPYVEVTHTGGMVAPEPEPDPTLSYSSIELDIGNTAALSVQNPTGAVIWSSSNTSVATVSSNGVVTGREVGTATITAYVSGYGTLTCDVLVTIADGTYFIQNKDSLLFVDFENSESNGCVNGAVIHQWDINGANSQKWTITHLSNGIYSIQSAASSSAYYLGIETDSTEEGLSVILREGPIADEMRWRIESTDSAAYKFTPISGEEARLVLALDPAYMIPTGYPLCQMFYTDDDEYTDEWILYDFDTAVLLAIDDVDGGSRHNYFSETKTNLQTPNNGMVTAVSTIRYSDCSVAEMIGYLQNNDIFVIHTHGQQTGFKIGNEQYLYMYNLNNYDLSNLDFALLMTCWTGLNYDPSHITNRTPVNIVEKMVVCGAETVVGFKNITSVSDCNYFAPALSLRLTVWGMSVEDAIDHIDYTPYTNNMGDLAVVAGNANNTLR